MSSTRRFPQSGSLQNVLTTLHSTKVTNPKAILPAEILAMILDHLPIPDLFRFARTSKRMQEMVYDDTRWVQRLKSMGCWNDMEARQRVEDAMQRKLEAQRTKAAEEARISVAAVNRNTGGAVGSVEKEEVRKTSVALFASDEQKQKESTARGRQSDTSAQRQDAEDGGFDTPTLTSRGDYVPQAVSAAKDPMDALKILSRVRSIRGFARQEYGKVYGALAPIYFDMARSQSHTDPVLFRTYRDPEQQAQMLMQLRLFAKSDSAEGWHIREQKLDTMTGIFENAVLREFEQGTQSGDIDGKMRRYAHVLVILNGGSAGIDTFIQNNPVMARKDDMGNPLDCIRGVPAGHINLESSDEFFRQLAASMNEQADIIDRVFPMSVNVLTPFIERVEEDVISEYITTVFDEAHEKSIETYLKAVSGIFEQCQRFAITIKPSKASPANFSELTKQTIAACFEPHIDLYLQDELEFFKTKSESEVASWEKQLLQQEESTESFFLSNVSRQAAKQDFLSSFKKMVMFPVSALSTSSTTSTQNTATSSNLDQDANNRLSTTGPLDRTGTPRPDAPTTELAAKVAIMNSRLEGIRSLFSIEIALNLIHNAKTSLERIALFVKLGGQSGEEAKEQCEAIFVVLIQILGTRHIKRGFDKAVNHLSAYNPREIGEHSQAGVEPLVTFLELVNVGDLIQQMVDVFYVQELVSPKLSDGDDFLSPAVKEKKRFEQMLDERVAAGLNKGIDALMDEVEYICATTQLPGDFNPPLMADGKVDVSDIGPSETATKIVDMVSSHVGMLVGSTDKNMLEVFNQEVGLRLFTVLCKHLKRQRISVEGAIKLISDTNHYHGYIRTMRNKTLTEYFNALRELSQIYLISPDDAKDIGIILADSDRYGGIFRAEEVYGFAERRADWFLVKRDVEKAMYGQCCLM